MHITNYDVSERSVSKLLRLMRPFAWWQPIQCIGMKIFVAIYFNNMFKFWLVNSCKLTLCWSVNVIIYQPGKVNGLFVSVHTYLSEWNTSDCVRVVDRTGHIMHDHISFEYFIICLSIYRPSEHLGMVDIMSEHHTLPN